MNIQVGDRITYNTKYQENCMTIIKDDDMAEVYKVDNEKGNIKILKIERPKYEVLEEKKELLTDKEREFLKNIIKHYNNITLIFFGMPHINFKDEHYIVASIDYPDDNLKFSSVKHCKKDYTLEELGLEEN